MLVARSWWTRQLALFSLRCSRPEITEQTELTAKHGETKKRRPKDAVQRAGLRSRPADTAEPLRDARRTRVPRRVSVPLRLRVWPFLNILRVLARWLRQSENRSGSRKCEVPSP